ncbi:methyltransferase [Kangiella sp. TOML190]|uniref:class I SAM-dependent methyltransferase n=1 Tax=Kangiella sp. TOML190 TaxID=2931351 RepID=UPI002040E271|nr:class I SAM-dependent methyltransferase [Kangiella sp. TOML190]
MPQTAETESKLIQAYGIFLFENDHPTVKELEEAYVPSVHGHKTWDSSFLIMDYLLHKHLLKPKKKVMELGCGWGPASVFCAENSGAKVTGVDLDEDVFPFFQAQAEINRVKVKTLRKSFQQLKKAEFAKFDLVFGADICFWDSLTPIHFKLIKRALKAGVKDIIFADPGRSPFYELVELCQKHFQAEYLDWYSVEPEKFEGYILHIKNS